jgi:MerR family transcriptional regulator, heat shock protein HspR
MNRKKGYFSISAVARMFSVHQQTIRLYEREGLITPKRTEGNTRMFTEEDVDRLEEIIYLTHKLGINLAGVDMIIKLQKQIKKLQKQINLAFEETDKELGIQAEAAKTTVRESAQQLITIKTNVKKIPLTTKNKQKKDAIEESSVVPIVDSDNWEIDYEE